MKGTYYGLWIFIIFLRIQSLFSLPFDAAHVRKMSSLFYIHVRWNARAQYECTAK